MPRYSEQYITRLIAQHGYGALVDLAGIASGSELFVAKHPSAGLPRPIFVIFELITWIAQTDRSTIGAYYKTTPVAQMNCVLATLDTLGAVELYDYGTQHLQDKEASYKVDSWICENEAAIIDWAFNVLKNHSAELAAVCN